MQTEDLEKPTLGGSGEPKMKRHEGGMTRYVTPGTALVWSVEDIPETTGQV